MFFIHTEKTGFAWTRLHSISSFVSALKKLDAHERAFIPFHLFLFALKKHRCAWIHFFCFYPHWKNTGSSWKRLQSISSFLSALKKHRQRVKEDSFHFVFSICTEKTGCAWKRLHSISFIFIRTEKTQAACERGFSPVPECYHSAKEQQNIHRQGRDRIIFLSYGTGTWYRYLSIIMESKKCKMSRGENCFFSGKIEKVMTHIWILFCKDIFSSIR